MFQQTRLQQQELAKQEHNQRARRIVRKLLPGQEWALEDLSAILTRALVRAHLPHAQTYGALVESFFLVAPSGTGKTHFCSFLSAKLNKSGASYFHYIGCHSLPLSPGRTIEEGMATKLMQWEGQYLMACKKNPHVPPPIVVVMVDEPDHASIRVPECFRSMMDDHQVVLSPLKKGQSERVYAFPKGWTFLFIWAPNAPGDAHLMVEPGVPRLPAHPPDDRTDWDKVHNDIVNQFGRKAASIMKRLMTRDGLSDSIILLYRLSGEAKVKRCRECLLRARLQYRCCSGLNLRYSPGLDAEIAEWSEDRLPIFTQVRNQLGDAVGHLHGTQVSPGQWHCVDLQIRLRDGKLVATEFKDADEDTDALGELFAQHEHEENSGPAEEPGASEEPPSAQSELVAEGASSFPFQIAAFNEPRMIDSIEDFDHEAEARVDIGDASVPALAHWMEQSETHQGEQWSPISLPHIRGLYARAHLPFPPETVLTSVRKELGAAAANKPNFRWEGPPDSHTGASWYRTNDLHAVWKKHVHKKHQAGQRGATMPQQGPLHALHSSPSYHMPPTFLPGGSSPGDYALLLQQQQQQQQQQLQHQMMMRLHQQQQQQQQMMEQLTSAGRQLFATLAVPEFVRSREITPLVAYNPFDLSSAAPHALVRSFHAPESERMAIRSHANPSSFYAPAQAFAAHHHPYLAARGEATLSVPEQRSRQLLHNPPQFLSNGGLFVQPSSAGHPSAQRIVPSVYTGYATGRSHWGNAPVAPPSQTPSLWQLIGAAPVDSASFPHSIHPMAGVGREVVSQQVLDLASAEQQTCASPYRRRRLNVSAVAASHDVASFTPSSATVDEEMLPSPLDAASTSSAGNQGQLGAVRDLPSLTKRQAALLQEILVRNPTLRKYAVPPYNAVALLPFACSPSVLTGDDELARRLCASVIRSVQGVTVPLCDYRLLYSDADIQKAAPMIRGYIDLLNTATHRFAQFDGDGPHYMVAVDLPVLILLRRLGSRGIDGMSCISFLTQLIQRGLAVAARSGRLTSSDTRVHCFKVAGRLLRGPHHQRVELRFQGFADNRYEAVLHREYPSLNVRDLQPEIWERESFSARGTPFHLGLLHELSSTYLEEYQQACVQLAATTTHAEHMSISGFTYTAPHFAVQDAAFQRWCVSAAERNALEQFFQSNDRYVPATVQPSSADDALLQALLEAEAETAEENDAQYREHLADERAQMKRLRGNDHDDDYDD